MGLGSKPNMAPPPIAYNGEPLARRFTSLTLNSLKFHKIQQQLDINLHSEIFKNISLVYSFQNTLTVKQFKTM